MATSYTRTATYSNLTRLELEALRKGDFFAGGKALTVGDQAYAPDGLVGKGDINAEPYPTGPEVRLDDIYPVALSGTPGLGVSTESGIEGTANPSEFAQWFGPTGMYAAQASGFASAGTTWTDTTGVNFVTVGVQPGDVLLLTPTMGLSQNVGAVATVTTVFTDHLSLANIWNPATSSAALAPSADLYNYTIIRPNAVKLFAVPGSGPVGNEQSFMTVNVGAAIHNFLAPTVTQINNARVKDLVPPSYSQDPSIIDRSDWVYDFGTPRSTLGRSLSTLGYRVVLYPDIGNGSGPDLTKPISSLNPIIDPSISADDQRFTIDYKAGVIRFSCAPKLGGDLKPSGATNGTNPATGRLNLYATFWVVDLSLTRGNARTLWGVRTTDEKKRAPARVLFNPTRDVWEIGASSTTHNAFYVRSLGATEGSTNPYSSTRYSTDFGTLDVSVSPLGKPRYFSYIPSTNTWKFVRSDYWAGLGPADSELTVADKTALTLGDISNPAQGFGGDLNPSAQWDTTQATGARDTNAMLMGLPTQLLTSSYGTAHLRKGRYYMTDRTLHIPPGSTIEGEGAGTRILARINSANSGEVRPVFKVGPNTPWGVWDATSEDDPAAVYGVNISPTSRPTGVFRTEGMDVVWNPVRRVWAQVVANHDSVWFNEIGLDGTYRFSALGVDVHDTAVPLWGVGVGAAAQHHTGNHYPRIAYQEHTDEYSVVWADQTSVGGIVGPQVRYRAFKLNLNATSTNVPTLTFNSGSILVGSAAAFQDHPSLAVESFAVSTGVNYTALVTCWEYTTDSSYHLASSSVCRNTVVNGSTQGVANYINLPPYLVGGEPPIVSSTDTDWDKNEKFLSVWSVRQHGLLTGSAGSIDNSSRFLHNVAGLDLTQKGIRPGSKLHILDGASQPFGAAPPFLPTSQTSTTATIQVSSSNLALARHDTNHSLIAEVGPLSWAITPASYIQGAFYNWATSTYGTAIDVVNGQHVGDDSYYTMELDQPDFVRLSRGADNWLVVFQSFATNAFLSIPRLNSFRDASTPIGVWDLAGGIPANAQDVYREHVSTCRVVLSDTGTLLYPAPSDNANTSAANRNTGPVARATYSFLTRLFTGSLANVGAPPAGVLTDVSPVFDAAFALVDSSWGTTRLDGTTYLMITSGVNINFYPVVSHTNTTVTINGAFAVTPEAGVSYELIRVPASLEGRLARDFEVSGKSLGARPPITYRPNHTISMSRQPMNEAREVAAHNFFYRWGTYCPSLMPAATWTGQDWVVVNPAKNNLHSFTGAYTTNGANSLFSDVGWYFGTDVAGTSGTLGTLVKTWPTGAKILDRSSGQYFSITNVYDEHTVELAGHPLGLGSSGSREYFLILPSLPDAGGFKNQGYRIAANGEVIASTSYVTFADPPAANSRDNYRRKRELMRRVFPLLTYGANYPASGVLTDRLEESSHYKEDIYFNGIAPGRPKGVNELSVNEAPMVALAWGENFYGLLDNVVEGDVGSRVKQVEFYRQSFGPYNVTIKDLAIETSDTNKLSVLSRAHVYTNHGGSRAGNVTMATDGYRNVYVYPTRIHAYSALPVLGAQSSEFHRLNACYTNTEGHHPIHVEAGRPGQTQGAVNWYSWQRSPRAFNNAGMNTPLRYGDQNVTSKVVWDGHRFVCAWVSKQTVSISTSTYGTQDFQINIGYLSGDEDGGLQTNELVSAADANVDLTALGAVFMTAGGGLGHVDASVTAIDMACSGTTFAVVWAAGCVPSSTTVDDFRYSGSVLGVTIFRLDNAFPTSGAGTLGRRFLPGGGQNYVLGQTGQPGVWCNPKILWDGEKYSVFVQQTITSPAGPIGDSDITVCYVGENGPADPIQYKQQVGRNGGFGALSPTNSGQPLLDTDLTGIGYPVLTGSLPVGAPYYAQTYTDIVLTGGGVEVGLPFIAGQAPFFFGSPNGSVTSALTFQDTSGGSFSFLTGSLGPVQEGDILRVISGSNGGTYVIQSIDDTTDTLTINNLDPFTTTPDAGPLQYTIVRPAHPMVQPGDVLEVEGVSDGASNVSVRSTGNYPVLGYSPKTRILRVEGEFHSTDIPIAHKYAHAIRGCIRTGNTANAFMGSVLAPGRQGATLTPTKAGNPSWNTDWYLGYGGAIGFNPYTLETFCDAVYNPELDEYAVVFTSARSISPLHLWIATFNPNKRQFSPAKPLLAYQGGANLEIPFSSWKIAWNGKHYLVSGSLLTVQGSVFEQVAILVSAGLAVEERISLDTYWDNIGHGIISNTPRSVPGSGYGPWVTTSPGICPYPKSMNVVWNDKLNRWSITSCLSWSELQSAPFSNMTPNLIDLGVITAWPTFDNLVTVTTTAWIQPGMRVLFSTSVGLFATTWSGSATVMEIVSPTQFRVDCTLADIVAITVGTTHAFSIPREDVFTWTLGYTSAGIVVDDADGVALENVVISGPTGDVSERYSNMARPIWQSAGQTTGCRQGVGNLTLYPFNQYVRTGAKPPPQYNHRFMRPEGKVVTTRMTNVRSNTKWRFEAKNGNGRSRGPAKG